MNTDMTGDELIAAYFEELRRVYGDDIASRSYIVRSGSWYYLSVAFPVENGYKVDLCPKPMRRSEFEAELEFLRSVIFE